jgi:hypothetical protein
MPTAARTIATTPTIENIVKMTRPGAMKPSRFFLGVPTKYKGRFGSTLLTSPGRTGARVSARRPGFGFTTTVANWLASGAACTGPVGFE